MLRCVVCWNNLYELLSESVFVEVALEAFFLPRQCGLDVLNSGLCVSRCHMTSTCLSSMLIAYCPSYAFISKS